MTNYKPVSKLTKKELEERRAKQRAYYAANREEKLAYSKKYYSDPVRKAKRAAYSKAYYRKNKAEILAKKSADRKTSLAGERIRAVDKARYWRKRAEGIVAKIKVDNALKKARKSSSARARIEKAIANLVNAIMLEA